MIRLQTFLKYFLLRHVSQKMEVSLEKDQTIRFHPHLLLQRHWRNHRCNEGERDQRVWEWNWMLWLQIYVQWRFKCSYLHMELMGNVGMECLLSLRGCISQKPSSQVDKHQDFSIPEAINACPVNLIVMKLFNSKNWILFLILLSCDLKG